LVWEVGYVHPSGLPDRIKQRWFVGAHSNIGGGYEDDVLSQYPLAWMIEECQKLGLVFREPFKRPDYALSLPLFERQPLEPSWIRKSLRPICALGRYVFRKHDFDALEQKPAPLRDSFSEFGNGLWKYLIRSKREYRRIRPPEEIQPDKTMKSVNERIDRSVFDLAKRNSGPHKYNRRIFGDFAPSVRRRHFTEEPKYVYFDGDWSFFWLVVWLLMVSHVTMGITAWLRHGTTVWSPISMWSSEWLCGLLTFVIALLADLGESYSNHQVAMKPDGGMACPWNVCLTVCFVIRFAAVVAVLLLGIALVVACLRYLVTWLC